MTKGDADTTLAELRQHVTDFVRVRDWQQFHTPKNLSAAIVIEASELLELFQWQTDGQAATAMEDAVERAVVADELADVLIYALSLANALEVDLSTAILNKLARNEHRFPVEHWRGKAGRQPTRYARVHELEWALADAILLAGCRRLPRLSE